MFDQIDPEALRLQYDRLLRRVRHARHEVHAHLDFARDEALPTSS